MFKREPKGRIETGEIPVLRQGEEAPLSESPRDKGRTASRNLTIFKSFLLTALMVLTLYGMIDRGLAGPERWLPAAAAILGLFFISLFIADYLADTPRIAWVLVGLLAVLVAMKGLSLTWSIAQTETANELLRSSMYLASFVLAASSLSSRRLVGPFIDGMNLMVGVIAGYGMLQKTNPVEYANTSDGFTVSSTLEYANTVGVLQGMGIVLGLGRMTQLKNPVARGLYAALILIFGVTLYFTFSRGGILALGVGLVTLFVVGGSRLQMFANLLLVCGPLAWLVVRVQDLGTLFTGGGAEDLRAAEGVAFRTDLVIAVLAAFVLQAVYAVLVGRYELPPVLRRSLGMTAMIVVLACVGALGFVMIGEQRGSSETAGASTSTADEPEHANPHFTSVSSPERMKYWQVAWDEWKKYPLTGTGAGTFSYTWLQNRPGFTGVRQVHNLYLEQGTETGIIAFLALTGFAALLAGYLARATWRASGERKALLGGLTGAVAVYLISSVFEWHWYIPPSTIFFFILAGVAVKFASDEPERDT
jgi:hypothetical protein